MKTKHTCWEEMSSFHLHVFVLFHLQALAGHLLCHLVWCALHDLWHLRHVPQSLLPLPRQRAWGLQAAFTEDRELLRPQRVPASVASHRPAHYPAACHTGEKRRPFFKALSRFEHLILKLVFSTFSQPMVSVYFSMTVVGSWNTLLTSKVMCSLNTSHCQ